MKEPITRQEAQTMIDQARNRIMEQMVNKYEIRGAVDNARDKLYAYITDIEQQRMRNSAVQIEQTNRRLIALENRLRSMEGELSTLIQMLGQSLNRQTQIVNQNRRISNSNEDSIAILQRAIHQN